MSVKLDRNPASVAFHDQLREHILSQLSRQAEASTSPHQERGSSEEFALERVRSAITEAEKLTVRIGDQPPQPDTFRGRIGAGLVGAVRRMLFWLTPQIKSANISLIQALEQQLTVSQQILSSLENLSAAIDASEQRVEQRSRVNQAGVQSQIDDLRKAANRPHVLGRERKHTLDALYVAFEDEFRGSREEIRDRLSVYVPLLREHHLGSSESPVLDLGCGRGEWLELLKDEGFVATGVDTNWLMVTHCHARSLTVEEAEVIQYLRSVPSQSKGIVTAFHLLEHLSLDHLVTILDETVRILKPGGLAIFETPNPQNLMVGAFTFYTDPTHKNPIPSQTLSFLARSRGLEDVHVWHLNPHPGDIGLTGGHDPELKAKWNDLFNGPRDYAVIGMKGIGSFSND